MNTYTATQSNILKAADIIKRGGLVAFPTETVYGLGTDAFNAQAIAKIFQVKRRPLFDPLIVHIADISSVEKLSTSIGTDAIKLMNLFWPGPLTIILRKLPAVPDIVTAGNPSVAIRMPSHPVALELIKKSATPIAAPSANLFGYLSPTTAEHVADQLGKKVDFILDGGACSVGLESTILDLTTLNPVILRLGGVPLEEIKKLFPTVTCASFNPVKPSAPGQLLHHYAPKTPLKLIRHDEAIPDCKRVGLLAFKYPHNSARYAAVEVLSPRGDLGEAAANLFSSLHKLDKAGLDIIYVEPMPEIGLGRAIMDRINRALH